MQSEYLWVKGGWGGRFNPRPLSVATRVPVPSTYTTRWYTSKSRASMIGTSGTCSSLWRSGLGEPTVRRTGLNSHGLSLASEPDRFKLPSLNRGTWAGGQWAGAS